MLSILDKAQISFLTIFKLLFYLLLFLKNLQPLQAMTLKERESMIFQGRIQYAEEQVELGDTADCERHYETAFQFYKNALDALSPSKLTSTYLYEETQNSFYHASLHLIKNYISDYKYKEFKFFIKKITNKPYNLKSHFLDTIVLKVDQLHSLPLDWETEQEKNLLAQADAYLELENWKEALSCYEKLLSFNKNNLLAQIGIQFVNEEKKYLSCHFSNQKAAMIKAMDNAWTLPISNSISSSLSEQPSSELITNKIHTLKIPNIDFYDTPLREAIDLIKKKVLLIDNSSQKGINIVLELDSKRLENEPKVTFSLRDTPLEEILKYLTQQTNLQYSIEPYSIVISSEENLTNKLTIKEYKISPDFIETLPNEISEQDDDSLKLQKRNNDSIKDFLISQGITFPAGAMVHYYNRNNILIVKNNQNNLNLINTVLENYFNKIPCQVEVEARFVEVRQNSFKEKGVDWLLGAFQLANKIGDGTTESQLPQQSTDYVMKNSRISANTIINKFSGSSSGNGTAGSKINANALESLLLGNSLNPTTGAIALAGVLTNPQFQVILRAITQHKGVNLLSAPKITVSSGRKATIKIAREFPYPEAYTPPQIPQNQGNSVNPAIPSTPSIFKKRNVGVQLTVEPLVDEKKSLIDIKLSPQITEFQGFINYGNPIFTQAPVFLGGQTNAVIGTAPVLLTQNSINQPVFSVREVNTQVSLYDGQTIVLGGLIREDLQKVDDKIPLLGNIPLLKKVFSSSSKQKVKRNLLIFVTVHLLKNFRNAKTKV